MIPVLRHLLRHLRRAPTAAALAVVLACAGPAHYTDKRADLSSMQKVAVLPFDNMSEERLAGDKVHRLFVAELLNSDAFEVVESARVVRALREERIESPGAMSPEEIQRLGKALKVEGLFLGTILDFSDPRGASGAAPVITIQFKLVETSSGTTVWAMTRHRGGTSVRSKLFGFAPATSTEVATAVVREALHTITR